MSLSLSLSLSLFPLLFDDDNNDEKKLGLMTTPVIMALFAFFQIPGYNKIFDKCYYIFLRNYTKIVMNILVFRFSACMHTMQRFYIL